MLLTGIGCAVLALAAALLSSMASTAHAADLWLAVMIGAFALGGGSVVGLWASGDVVGSRLLTLKRALGICGGILVAPGVAIAMAMFAFLLLPAIVVIVPWIAFWDLGALGGQPPKPHPPILVPQHA